MALAKYVIALVKKDKPQEELKSVMQGQMEVFLQNETKNFIELLFQALDDKAYLQQEPPAKAAVKQVSSIRIPSRNLLSWPSNMKFARCSVCVVLCNCSRVFTQWCIRHLPVLGA